MLGSPQLLVENGFKKDDHSEERDTLTHLAPNPTSQHPKLP